MERRVTSAFAGALAGVLLLAGCASLPRDPDGTLERVRASGVLRAGASPTQGFVAVDADGVTGPEVELVAGFADGLGARVEWRAGGEEELVTAMEAGELDVLVGGLTEQTPWDDRVSVTRPYLTTRRGDRDVRHVLAVPLGENATLVALETYLDRRHDDGSRP